MGLIDEQLADDATMFVDGDMSASVESVTYTPPGNNSPTTFNAQVFREPPAEIEGAPRGLAPVLRVFIRNHATLGLSAMPDRGGGTITVAKHQGGATSARPIDSVISSDAGGWMVQLR